MTEKKEKKRQLTDWILIKRLIPYLFHKRKIMIITGILILLRIVFQVLGPFLIMQTVDNAITLGDSRLLLTFIGILFFFYTLSALIRYFITWFFSYLGEHAIYKIRKAGHLAIQNQSIDYFDKTPTGDVIAKMTSDIEAMNVLLSGQVLNAFTSFLFLIGAIFVMLSISPLLTIASVICIPIVIGISVLNKYYIRSKIATFRKTNAKLTSTMTENVMGSRVSRSFAREDYNQQEFEKINQKHTDDLINSIKFQAFVNPFYEYAGSLSSVFVLIVGGFLVLNNIGGLTPGILLLFVLYISNFAYPLIDLANVYGELQSSFAAFERICLLIDHPISVVNKPETYSYRLNEGTIEFVNIDFAYKEELPIFQNFNLTINAGETIAIVGETGAGKTTIAKLIIRLYDIPQPGQILLDGINVEDYSLESLRDQIGYVLQEPFLFSESIRFNLCYGKKVSDDVLKEVLTLVGANFVLDLPNGLDTVVGERGSRLSLGQRQLLSFARVLVKDPKILLLDEATSSIDPQAELQIQRAMVEMSKNRTSLIIAHRLSTVRQADRIIVLDKGQIIEQGPFDELLEQKGEFHRLYSLQFNGKDTYQEVILPNSS
ncbi:MAG: ABC transporter ATP-binding protein [Candidatus Hodarchaeales archaeon]|jgi:ABC-type multidrug transport system fused ATPase/permease subunit